MTPRRAFFARVLRTAAVAGAATTLVAPAYANDAALARPTQHRQSNPVVHWNTIAGEAFAPSQGTNPMAQSRTFAILHAAIHGWAPPGPQHRPSGGRGARAGALNRQG